jgi:hypothetical protein
MSKSLAVTQTVAEFLADRIAAVDKTQKQIATECGFDNPNVGQFWIGTTPISGSVFDRRQQIVQ